MLAVLDFDTRPNSRDRNCYEMGAQHALMVLLRRHPQYEQEILSVAQLLAVPVPTSNKLNKENL